MIRRDRFRENRSCFMPRASMTLKALAAGLVSLAFTAAASAQFYGGGLAGTPAGSQAYARGLAGSPAAGQNITTFAPVTSSGGGWGWGGGGNQQAVATPWSSQNGSWIQQAGSYWGQDEIARNQDYTSRFFQGQDYQHRQLQLRRAAFDEMLYEKLRTPPPEVGREELRQNRLARARNTPPLEEIASGAALNELLTNLQRVSARENVNGPAIPVDQDILGHVNVTTTGDDRGSNELFKPGGFPDWPSAFADPRFEADKKAVQGALYDLSKAQEGGKLNPAKITQAQRTVEGMRDKLYGVRFQTGFREYVDGLEFLQKLADAVGTLGKKGANNYLNGTYAAKGGTAGEVADYMIKNGLKFAKATPGAEPYYEALYQRLVSYELGINRLVGQSFESMASIPPRPPMPMPPPNFKE
jgi:hypothetical protein